MRIIRSMALILLTISILLLTACTTLEEEGIDSYNLATCSFGLTRYLFPSEDYLERFPYEDSIYHYLDTGDLAWGYAKAFASLRYDAAVYEDAKSYCMENFNLEESLRFACDDYRFMEHICYQSKDAEGNRVPESRFPMQFNLFGFHDETHTLFFLGYYNGDASSEERALATENFSAFLESAYGEYFRFSE